MHCKGISVFLLFLVSGSVSFGQSAGAPPPGLDGRFVELARQVPGFGGYFFDARGDLNVYLIDSSRAPAVRAAVADVARSRHDRPDIPWSHPAEIVVRRGDYDFPQLNGWRRGLLAAIDISEVHFLDTDEAANRIRVGVATQQAAAQVQARADALGVPRKALVVEVVRPGMPIANLDSYIRPTEGGLHIVWNGNNCTLGVNAWYANPGAGIPAGTEGFLTASHCSSTWLSTDNTVYTQGGQQIGYERWDPPFFTNAQNTACPPNSRCRWSDVSFAAYDAGVSWSLGHIARTHFYGLGPGQTGSTDINPNNPHFRMYGGVRPTMGMFLSKVGRTTGWTTGTVSGTCIDVKVTHQGYDYWILCQDEVNAHVAGGDSGGPVFGLEWYYPFAGIVWYRTAQGRFIFSNSERINKDFGKSLTLF